jgi:hypothetical protein
MSNLSNSSSPPSLTLILSEVYSDIMESVLGLVDGKFIILVVVVICLECVVTIGLLGLLGLLTPLGISSSSSSNVGNGWI